MSKDNTFEIYVTRMPEECISFLDGLTNEELKEIDLELIIDNIISQRKKGK